jgi:hypothetical protein
MLAILNNGRRKVVGKVLQNGIGRITLVVSGSIKGYDKSKWNIKILKGD